MQACDKEKPNKARWSSCMLLFDPDDSSKLLVCKRAPHDRTEPGSWGFAGGKVDAGETPAEAVVREVFEETGITVYHYKFIGSFQDDIYTDFVFVGTTWFGGIDLDLNECTEYEWVTLSDIKEQVVCNEPVKIFSFTQATVEFYESYMAGNTDYEAEQKRGVS